MRALLIHIVACLFVTLGFVQAATQTKDFVSINGEVRAPIRLPFVAEMTLMDAVQAGGGLTKHAGNRIRIIRKGKTTSHDYAKARKDPKADTKLQAGDKVIVFRGDHEPLSKSNGKSPARKNSIGSISVAGEVKLPGKLNITEGMNLVDALAARGGVTDFAKDSVILVRAKKRVTYALSALTKDPKKAPLMQASDRVIVLHR